MLCLARRVNEKIILRCGNDRIEVMITKVRHGNIHVGIKAPPHVDIVRAEIEGTPSDKSRSSPRSQASGMPAPETQP